MEPQVVAVDAALRSIESAMAEALKSGADEEEVFRVANTACNTRTGRILDTGSTTEDISRAVNRKKTVGNVNGGKKDTYLSNRETRFALVFFAVFVLSIVNSICFTGQEFRPAEIKVVYADNFKKYDEDLSGSDLTIETAISQYNMGAISLFLHNVPINGLPKINGLPLNRTEHPCPLDVFFHDGCETRNGGVVCIFPGAVLKRVKASLYDAEVGAFQVLNDTRIFPKLYYEDKKCRTFLQENINPLGLRHSNWCANYTYYEDFYKRAFEIFAANNIIPHDLNACCNTLVDGDRIRIFDFGRYFLNQPPEKVRSENEKLLKKILKDVQTSVEDDKKSRSRCLD